MSYKQIFSPVRVPAHDAGTRATAKSQGIMERKETKKQNPETFDCEHCLNYEWWNEEIGYQCRYLSAPPCDEPVWPIDETY